MDELIAIPLAEYNHLKRCEKKAYEDANFQHDEEVRNANDLVYDALTGNKFSPLVYEQETTPAGV